MEKLEAGLGVNSTKLNANNCLAVAEMGDSLATIDIGRKLGAVPLWEVSWVPI